MKPAALIAAGLVVALAGGANAWFCDGPIKRGPSSPAAAAVTGPRIIEDPAWLRAPTALEFGNYYPERAARMEKTGRVEMTCIVNDDGTLGDCKVTTEVPAGFGFGEAALKMKPLFRMPPQTPDGRSVGGGTVKVPINFNIG